MRTARAAGSVALGPEAAMELWTDVRRWPTFIEGFGHVVERSEDWPARGARVVWESGPSGRGRVTERVVQGGGRRFATQVFEDALNGEQSISFTPDEGGPGSQVELRLEYELTKYGPLRAVADVLFIRRALRDSLRRTLSRFAVEAEEEAGLR